MRVSHTLTIALIVTASLGARADRHAERDGSSFERAIIIRAPDKEEVKREFASMRKLCPDMKIVPGEQALSCREGVLYDIWTVSTPRGDRTFFFDLGRFPDCEKKKSSDHSKAK